jgi:uncharacterized repeat protein (TIGR01451 family)
MRGSLQGSTKRVQPTLAGPGDVLTYTITLRNPGPTLPNARLTDTLSSDVDFRGNLWASAGSYGQAGGVITWTGSVAAMVPVTVTFEVAVDTGVAGPLAILNVVQIDDGLGNVQQRQAGVIVDGYSIYLPLIER